MITRAFLLLMILLASMLPVAAQEPWVAAPFTAPPQALLKAATQVADSVDVVVLTDEQNWSFDAQRRSTFTLHRIYVIRTAAGVRDWSITESRWEPWHESRPVLKARVISPAGDVHQLDVKTIAEVPVGEEDEIYSDARILRAALPGVAPGVVVEELITVSETSPHFGAGVCQRVDVGYSVPVQHSSISIEAPSSVPLRYGARLLPDIETTRSEENGRVRVAFRQGPMKPLEGTEPYLPFDVPRRPYVTFSTGESWADVAAAYNRIAEDQIRGADVRRLLPKLSGEPRLDIANALLARLHQDIRYTGIEFAEASIVPRTPAETLQRKYGDCKDQAALLVSMLRSAGIPAELALLNAGKGYDVDPDMPGMGQFNHVIVHVPGTPELWADPTNEFSRFNELPLVDQNRRVLLVNEKGTLVRTPDAKSSDNGWIERREFFLQELGKANVVETTEAWGSVEMDYRDSYDTEDPKRLNEGLKAYVKSEYLSEVSPKYEHDKAIDLSKHFRLRLEVTDAARGTSADTDAVVAIPVGRLFERLPELSLHEAEAPPQRKGAMVIPEPYTAEWRYRIVPPMGFRSASLPDSGTRQMGPATLSKEFKVEPDGVVSGSIRFDTGKPTYSVEEVAQFQKALRELNESPMLMVRFEQVGETLLAEGKIREALDEFRKLAAAHPKEALHHIQIARAYLAAGAGESARKEARMATELEPKSAPAYATLAWTLQHDLVGRTFKKGCDLPGAEAAYRTALQLDPTNYENRANLAIVLEYSPAGQRYANKENLNRAIKEYLEVEGKLDESLAKNVLFALLRAQRFDELCELANKRPRDATVDALFLAGVAAKSGLAEAVAQAAKRIPEEKDRTAALLSAGQTLVRMRLYQPGADLIETASAGSPQAATLRASVAVIRHAQLYEGYLKGAPTPMAAFLRCFAVLVMADSPPESVRSAFAGGPFQKPDNLKAVRAEMAPFRVLIEKAGMPVDVAVDVTLGAIQGRVDGDESGYRIRADIAGPTGATKITAFVVRQAGDYKVVTIDEVGPLGSLALGALDAGKTEEARRWLDWAREVEQLKGGEDPLAGTAFPRFWSRGSDASPEVVRNSAASLMALTEDADRAIPILKEGWAKASTPANRLNFDLALAAAYRNAKMYELLRTVSQDLLQQYPDSDTAFQLVLLALRNLNGAEELMKVVNARLARHPEDRLALGAEAFIALKDGDGDRCIEIEKKIISEGSPSPTDWNNAAWASLVGNHVTPETIEFAQKGVYATQSMSFNSLHTLAALYAEVGKTTEAREVILQGMDVGGQEEPEGNSWYVFGRIAEQYGIDEAALIAYRRVEKPEHDYGPDSTWALAQRRIALLTGKK